jgi:hypothetical protein
MRESLPPAFSKYPVTAHNAGKKQIHLRLCAALPK